MKFWIIEALEEYKLGIVNALTSIRVSFLGVFF